MKKKATYKQRISNEFVDEQGDKHIQTLVTERVEGYVDLKLPTKKLLNNGNFIVLFQKTLDFIGKNKKSFSKDELILLFYLIGNAGIGNSVVINYPILMRETGIQRTNCVTAINNLIRKNIIIKNLEMREKNEPKTMQLEVNFDQLNYRLAYKGNSKVPRLKQANIFGELDDFKLGVFHPQTPEDFLEQRMVNSLTQ